MSRRRSPVRFAVRAVELNWPWVLLLVGWQLWVTTNGYTALVAPTPVDVARDLGGHPNAYVSAVLVTAVTALLGLVIGTVLATLAAVAVWSSALVTAVVTPAALIMRSVPVVAAVPALIAVLGTGLPAVVAITVVVTFFPTFGLVGSGLRSAPVGARDLFSVLGAGRLRTLRLLLLPHALPQALVAIRLSAPGAILSAMLAEYLIGKSGLGYLFVNSISYAQYARAWGAGVVATVLAVVFFLAATRLERWGLSRAT